MFTVNPSPTCDSVFIRGMKLEMVIGVDADELNVYQTIEFDVDIWPSRVKPVGSDDVSDVISYADIFRDFQTIAKASKVRLLETFGENMAGYLLDKYPVRRVRICMTKRNKFSNVLGSGVVVDRRIVPV